MGDYTYINGLVNAMGSSTIKWIDEIIYEIDKVGTGKRADI